MKLDGKSELCQIRVFDAEQEGKLSMAEKVYEISGKSSVLYPIPFKSNHTVQCMLF